MRPKLFFLIHNERPYKRYYNQPLEGHKCGFLYELAKYGYIFQMALRLPFMKKYNSQQIPGERKSKWQMVKENLAWAFKYKEVCTYYFVYGLDLKSRNPKDYMAYTEFRVLRNIINIRQWENKRTGYTFNYLALVRDKFVFYQYCKSLGIPHPKTIALISKGHICFNTDEGNMDWNKLEDIVNKDFVGFCKESKGQAGIGAFLIEVENGIIKINKKESTIEELRERIGTATYIVQERVKNHHVLSTIYPDALSTLRLHTMLKDDGEVDFFSAVQRFGANGSIVDNCCAGGMFVGVSESGILNNFGCHEPQTGNKKLIIPDRHPNSNEQFSGLKLPHWDEVIETAKKFHKFLYGIPSIGWDIAITEDGFCFIEAGEDWEIALDQSANGAQREKFYKYHGHALDIKLRKY